MRKCRGSPEGQFRDISNFSNFRQPGSRRSFSVVCCSPEGSLSAGTIAAGKDCRPAGRNAVYILNGLGARRTRRSCRPVVFVGKRFRSIFLHHNRRTKGESVWLAPGDIFGAACLSIELTPFFVSQRSQGKAWCSSGNVPQSGLSLCNIPGSSRTDCPLPATTWFGIWLRT